MMRSAVKHAWDICNLTQQIRQIRQIRLIRLIRLIRVYKLHAESSYKGNRMMTHRPVVIVHSLLHS